MTARPGVDPAVADRGRAAVTATARSRVDGTVRPTHIVDPRGRAKILRPLPTAEREAAVARGLAAYARGDFFLAHEELEPAWMGSADPGERELLAGLIKVAAAFVHVSRGNPTGAATNLRGARVRLAGAAAAGHDGGFDIAALLRAVDERLAQLETEPSVTAPVALVPDQPHDVAGPPGRARRPPLALEPPTIERKTLA